MNQTLNYVSALPDFLTMQRISFCWFLVQGLTEELALFSRIDDFSQNTEYLIFGEEYKLIKPPYTLLIARKYSGNYSAQLIIPLEVRKKSLNEIDYRTQIPMITFPLMTDYATFILNGCERVIVSQIIRSPGVYFEKNKTQKSRKQFQRKLSTSVSKLRTFLPSGQAFLSESTLFSAVPTLTITKDFNIKTIPKWNSDSVSIYSFKKLKKLSQYPSVSFFQSFKFYQILVSIVDLKVKSRFIQLFLKWIKKNIELKETENNFINNQILVSFYYFQFLSKILLRYQFLNSTVTSTIQTNFSRINDQIQNDNEIILSENQLQQLCQIYGKWIFNSQILLQVKLNEQLFFTPIQSMNLAIQKTSFSVLKKDLQKKVKNINILQNLIIDSRIKPVIYFSTTLNDELRYLLKLKEDDKILLDADTAFYKPNDHQYLKTKTQLLTYKQDHEIKTDYNRKYDEKELYTAVLIPEYGSWIRFGFQKNTKIQSYQYPIKNQEDEVMIQLDKINQKPVLALLKEMGLTDFEIYQNLEYSDFFYFTKPLLISSSNSKQPISRFNLQSSYLANLSEFSQIFDYNYFRLGRTGRMKLNNKLNLHLPDELQIITYEDIFAIIDHLLNLSISKIVSDDIDHLKNRRVRSIGELLQNLFKIGFQRLIRKLKNQVNKSEHTQLMSFQIINSTIREFFGSSQLSQYLDQTNPLSSLTHRRRISGLGPGGFDRDRISFSVRDIHPSHYGRICPIETPEGQNVGLISSLTTCARINKLGFLETPFWRVINGKVLKTGNPIYLTADLEDFYKIAPADLAINSDNYLIPNVISVRYQQDFQNVTPSEVDFIVISTIQMVSVAASLIPFFEHDDANRALMGSNMQRQSVPLILPQKPIVGTGLENQIASDSGTTITSEVSGIVHSVTANKIVVTDKLGKKFTYKLQKYLRSNQQTYINQRPIVWKGEKIKSGQILTDGPAISNNELALGQNVLVAYMPWQGYNFEDAILISERLVYDDIFTSIHIERYKVEIDQNLEMSEQTTNIIPTLSLDETKHLNDDGIIKIGTFVKAGDILVGKVIANNTFELLPESRLLRAIFGAKAKGVSDNSYRLPKGKYGRIIETVTFNRRLKSIYKFEKVYIFIAQIRKIQIGDKIAGRHGNKGIISRILARQDMPFLPDGTPIDVILNPLGVPSRMNVGQLYECLLGLAGDKLNMRFKILPFDEMYGIEMSRILINKKLRQASVQKNESWLFNPYAPGKMVLIDGRTGEEFENPITVGNAYMLKLIHLVDDKMHARATGPYSLITQQPLRGKAQQGGQRFGEMEVWALEGFGSAFTLQELVTIKSDDMKGRNETLDALVKGKQISKFGVPESFKVLLQELRSIGLDMSTYKIEQFSSSNNYDVEINLIEKYNASSKTFSPISNIKDISF